MTISIKHLENLPAALRRLRNEQTLIDDDAPLWKMTDAVNKFFEEIGYGDSITDDPPGLPRRRFNADIERFNDGTGTSCLASVIGLTVGYLIGGLILLVIWELLFLIGWL